MERAIRGQKVSDLIILLHAVVIDNAAERLLEQADGMPSVTGAPERRENWQRAVRRAALLADESFPHGPVAQSSTDCSRDEGGKSSSSVSVSRKGSPGQNPGRHS